MRERLQDWAAYFGALGIAFWAAAAILKVIGSQPDQLLIMLLVVGVVFFALYVYLRPSDIKQLVSSRGARYGSNALVISVAFVGIVVLLNFMSSRYHYRQDLTANKTFTLSPLTVKVLQDLKQPVTAVAFFTAQGGSNMQEVQDRLKDYANQSSMFTYRFVDPQAEPQVANDYKVQFDGTVVMERGTRREIASGTDEENLTNAIVKVTSDSVPSVYFTTGHGERSPDDTGNNGLSMMKSAMESENYKVATLDLKTITDTLPADTTLLVVAGPKTPFEPAETKIISDYLGKSGRVIFMVDPQTQTGLDSLLQDWGLKLDNDIVYDPKFGISGQAQVPVINSYPSHAVTQDLSGISTLFPGTRSIQAISPAPTGKTVTALLTTSDQSWGETDFASVQSQTAKYDANADVKGPLNIGYAVEGTGTTAPRIVVFGNSNFISNGTVSARLQVAGQLSQTGNGLLFGNSLHWLAGQENLIAIPAKSADTHPIFLTGEQSSFVFWSSFLFIPLAIMIIGILVWWRRR